MRQGFVSRLLVGSAFGLVADAAACNPLAVSLPFKSNVLANRVEVRGVQWQVGGPSAQTIALLPSALVSSFIASTHTEGLLYESDHTMIHTFMARQIFYANSQYPTAAPKNTTTSRSKNVRLSEAVYTVRTCRLLRSLARR